MRSIIAASALEARGGRSARTLAQQRVGAVLEERHLAAADPLEGRLVDVEDADAQAGLREREAQRQPDVAPAAEDDEVENGTAPSSRVVRVTGRHGHATSSR